MEYKFQRMESERTPKNYHAVENRPGLVEVGDTSNLGLWVRAAQLPHFFCSSDLAYRCTRSGWLKPIIKGKRRTIYRLSDVLSCMRRIEKGELPPARSKKDLS